MVNRQGQSWDTEETLNLRDSFEKMTPVDQIAKEHGRTVNAIVARLVLMGLVVEIPNLRGYFRVGECFHSWAGKSPAKEVPTQESFLKRKPLPAPRVVASREEEPPF